MTPLSNTLYPTYCLDRFLLAAESGELQGRCRRPPYGKVHVPDHARTTYYRGLNNYQYYFGVHDNNYSIMGAKILF